MCIMSPDVHSSASLSVFRQRLKTFLFRKSFPDLAYYFNRSVSDDYTYVDFAITFVILATFTIDIDTDKLAYICTHGTDF